MISLKDLLRDLRELQFRLQETANRLWSFENAVNRLLHCFESGDFLPRRLSALRLESQIHLQSLLEEVSWLLRRHFRGGLVRIFHSCEARDYAKIRILLKHIQNAYVTDLPMRGDLEVLRGKLPRHSG